MVKILFVEDDINLREIYAARLSAEDYTVVVASDGEEALAKAVQEKPDLIVLDVMMPKISGFDVLDIIRSTPEIKNTKVIVLTALSQEADRQRADSLGASKYLVKSQITLEDVVDAIKVSLGQPTSSPAPNDNSSQADDDTAVQAKSDEPAAIHDVSGSATSSSSSDTNQDDTPAEEIEDKVQTMLEKTEPSLNTKNQDQKSDNTSNEQSIADLNETDSTTKQDKSSKTS
jgi:DNA-binding response OmpR family regulator